MKRLTLVIVAVVALSAAQASAEWRTRSVAQTRSIPHSEQIKIRVKVYPPPIAKRCSEGFEHWIQQESYWEERTETRTYYTTETYWVTETYWIVDPFYVLPPLYVDPPRCPIYIAPTYIPWQTVQPYIYIAP